MELTLSAKVLDVIFLPGTWNGFETASTYAAWNLLKNCTEYSTKMWNQEQVRWYSKYVADEDWNN